VRRIATNLADILSFHPPSYVSGLILICGLPYTACFPAMTTPFTSTTNTPLFQITALSFIRRLTAPGTRLPHLLHQALLGDVMVQPRACCIRLLSRMQNPKGFFEAGKAGLPMLIIEALQDLTLPGRKMFEAVDSREHLPGYEGWKDLQVVQIAGAGHMPFFEKPEEFRTAVLEFAGKVLSQNVF